MRVLVVKTSSLGDVIHTLPALTDAAAACPGLVCDWLVEEPFAEIPAWHPAVERVIPVALRRWRRTPAPGEIRRFIRQLRQTLYDHVIDAQGLLFKSAPLAALARGPAAGYDFRSVREPLASLCYRRRHRVSRALHAVTRIRRLFALELGYPVPGTFPDYGLRLPAPVRPALEQPYLILLHATTWPSKHWPEPYWAELARLALAAGYRVWLPGHTPGERQAAERIAASGGGSLLPRCGLTELAGWLDGAAGVVGVDTGLAHLTAALGTPAVTLYGPTRVELTGALGAGQRNLTADFPCAPCQRRVCRFRGPAPVRPACFAQLPPERVWEVLRERMAARCAVPLSREPVVLNPIPN
jgi:heptosyltransferase-1